MTNTKSLLLATAAAALFASGYALAQEKAATEAKVQCAGVNACTGKSDCKMGTNASCQGMNACKGIGGVYTKTEEECEAKKAEAKGVEE